MTVLELRKSPSTRSLPFGGFWTSPSFLLSPFALEYAEDIREGHQDQHRLNALWVGYPALLKLVAFPVLVHRFNAESQSVHGIRLRYFSAIKRGPRGSS
jgi:hypothetical protein